MYKSDLVAEIAKQQPELKVKDIKAVIDAVFDTMKAELANGGNVTIKDFGSFTVVEKADRIGRNPQTGEEMLIEAHKAPKFKASSALKDAVK